ncbi:MAG: type II secretion system protein N [Hyphomonadaceae bacterium]
MARNRRQSVIAGISERAMGAVRPGVEALLLAAVALGCAQAGWSVLTPSSAGAINMGADEPRVDTLQASEVLSPFAPQVAQGEGYSQAAAALLSGVQLSGVRVADDPARSGAVLTLNDGAQRAFAVGQEISAGVTLEEVGANYVLVAYDGGRRQISMTTAPSFSFARAMMGLEQAPGAPVVDAPAPVQQEGAAQTSFTQSQAAAPSQADIAWLRATFAQNVGGRGWRVAEPLPQAAVDAGLRAGDLITSVNGARPGDAAGILAAAQDRDLALQVERGGEQVMLSVRMSERT